MTNYFYLNQEENNAQHNEAYSFREISISVQLSDSQQRRKSSRKMDILKLKH